MYRVVTEDGVQDFESERALVAAMEDRGLSQMGRQTQYPTGIKLRAELIGQPKFSGMVGPMWGGYLNPDGTYDFSETTGEPSVRYEDWPTYDRMSR